jgi:hypothetical protein
MRFIASITAIILTCGSVSCRPDSTAAETKDIHGENDLVPVDAYGLGIPKRYHEILPAIGRLQLNGVSICTATHIGDGVVLTAGHCDATVHSCQAYSVEWNARKGTALPRPTSKCVEEIARKFDPDNGIDYWLFRVDAPPAAKIELAPERELKFGKALTMFSHPQGRLLEWSDVCKFTGDDPDFETFLTHDCDSEQGSSGAVVLDNTDLKIIGIHSTASGGAMLVSGVPELSQEVGATMVNGIKFSVRSFDGGFCFATKPAGAALPDDLPGLTDSLTRNGRMIDYLVQDAKKSGDKFLTLLEAHRYYAQDKLAVRGKWRLADGGLWEQSMPMSRCQD